MIDRITDCTTLHNGVKMPWMGLGVYKAKEGKEVENAVKDALKLGYRSIDTAAAYRNEGGVGKALAEAEVAREEVFVTTKVNNPDQGYESTLQAFEESRKKLGLEYLDLYLIHWPVKDKYKDTWRALEKLYHEGLVRAIGVSNFQIHHLEDLFGTAKIIPMVNQVECHPYLTQKELLTFCKQKNIQLEAWSPLAQGLAIKDQTVIHLSQKYQKTPAQILIRWDLQNGIVTIPKSVHENRIKENGQVFDFALAPEDMAMLDGMNENRRIGPDPDNFNF